MKRTHIMTQYKRRYYKENKMINYFEEVLNEIKIYLILNNKNDFVVKLFQILFDFNNNHQYLYLINEFFDCGCIMNRDNVNYNHFHNPKIIKCFYNMKFEYENENLIKKRFLNMNIKHSIAKIIFKKIFLGLKFIHSNRISHRDIKIENILFDSKDKNPKIIDFSISTIHNNVSKNPPIQSSHDSSLFLFLNALMMADIPVVNRKNHNTISINFQNILGAHIVIIQKIITMMDKLINNQYGRACV